MTLFHFLSLQTLCFMFSWGAGEGIGWEVKDVGSFRKHFLVAAAIGLLCELLNSSFGMSIGVECICLSWAAAMCCGSEQGCTTHGVSGGAKSTFLQPHNR